jgi:hypothetical protein
MTKLAPGADSKVRRRLCMSPLLAWATYRSQSMSVYRSWDRSLPPKGLGVEADTIVMHVGPGRRWRTWWRR